MQRKAGLSPVLRGAGCPQLPELPRRAQDAALTEVFGSRSRLMRVGLAAEHTHPPCKEKMS